ncbi:hypothetical protein [Nostoc sp.]
MTQIKTKLTGVPRTMLMTTRARVDEHQEARVKAKSLNGWQN